MSHSYPSSQAVNPPDHIDEPGFKRGFAIDWDGTLVHPAWPACGDFMPGAVDAVKKLLENFRVYVFTCRANPDLNGVENAERMINEMRERLDAVGLQEVEIWTGPAKPLAVMYVDDRAFRFTGDWSEVLEKVYGAD